MDVFTPADQLPTFSIEKKVGPASPQQLVLRHTDAMVNTLNITAPAGALATFSAGVITAGETRQSATITTPSYPSTSDDLLVFHGGRVRNGPNGGVLVKDETFQSIEVAVNNNIAADEYTVRPSRFLRSLTEGIRAIDVNMTLVFENPDKYSQYTYGASAATSPGYSFYLGALEIFLGNFQIANTEDINTATTATPTSPQAVQLIIPKIAFTGFPVALATGRIAVTTSARALRDPNQTNIMTGYVRPTGAGLTY